MPRGPKKHLKRINAPHHWMLGKMDGAFAPKPSAGPHKMRECLPVCLILRNRLKYALTGQECKQICMEKCVKIDGKTRTDYNYPAGFMDVVEMEKTEDRFRLLYDTKGRFVLQRLTAEEASYKLCRVTKMYVSGKKIPCITTHDGRTIRYPDPLIKVNDTIKLNLKTGEVVEYLKFDTGMLVTPTKGKNTGRVGHIVHVEKHPGSFDIVSVKDATGVTFSTRLENIFVIGKGGAEKPLVQLPKGKGIKLSILQERDAREAKASHK